MDFYRICTREGKRSQEIYPDFVVGRSKDLMIRGRSFYAIWDEERGIWSTDEYDVQRLVDADLTARQEELGGGSVKYLGAYHSSSWTTFTRYAASLSDNYHELDSTLTFANTVTKRSDYASRRLPYALEPGDYSAWDELVGTLYSVEERAKIEWAIGAIVSGDAKKIQKFSVFYGSAGTGKSTILGIIEKLFEGYTVMFDAKALGSSNSTFSTEVFKGNPLVAIQHDGDLSKLDDNTKLNSIVAHEPMTMNEKFKASYTSRVNAFLFMGTNQPVKISDAKSGLIRRLIDVNPTGVTFNHKHYNSLMSRIEFELGAIAHHCLGVYKSMGKHAYDGYRPLEMMYQTDPFFNFIEANYDIFRAQDGCTLKQAYTLYKEYCDDSGIRAHPQYKIREELRNYFDEFSARAVIDGEDRRSYYAGFNFNRAKKSVATTTFTLTLDETKSLLDEMLASLPAQEAKDDGTPGKRWDSVTTTLADIDTSRVHYVKVPQNHIVIDFDLKDEAGEKSLDRNLQAASVWPSTYGELSKSGSGVHLHYIYDGDTDVLASQFSDGIEIKVYKGNSSLRRKFTQCNDLPVATIQGGLPTKEKRAVLDTETMKSEKGLRDLIARNLRKEIHPGTKPSIDFIKKVLDDAYASEMSYDVSDLRPKIIAFANNSSNQAMICIKVVQQMRFQGAETGITAALAEKAVVDDRIVLFDIEVYPNLFVVCWKYQGSDTVVRMINPTAIEIEPLFAMRLVGFNNRRYDNHMLWGCYMGYDNAALYKLSQKIIDNDRAASFGEAYGVSYADIFDFSSKKQSLKKFQIELGLPHIEMNLPWDQPVPRELWNKVIDYCVNDVLSTEKTFEARAQDFSARQVLAELSGLTVNDTTQKHTARIIFGGDRDAQKKFVYTHLDEMFPGYKFDMGKSTYLGEDPGEGGYVYSEPGYYTNVALLDVASMHPTSIEQLNLFGPYTENFAALKAARIAIKHGKYDEVEHMFDGRLMQFLGDPADAKALSDALKIVINIVYGLTSAKFDNPFRDLRNVDNIVAKRGALFMIGLKAEVQARGFTVAHIKTDSIKIPDATPEIIEFVTEYGKKYGYDFEHEATYEKFCLVNDAVYVAYKSLPETPSVEIVDTSDGLPMPVRTNRKWITVGAQFAHPFVFKTLFSGEDITFEDMCETKSVTQGAMYLDFEARETPMALSEGGLHFVGKIGRFVPVLPGSGGAILWRIKEDKHYAVTGTKGYLWIEAGVAKSQGPLCEFDMSYYDGLVADARDTIQKFVRFEDLIG